MLAIETSYSQASKLFAKNVTILLTKVSFAMQALLAFCVKRGKIYMQISNKPGTLLSTLWPISFETFGKNSVLFTCALCLHQQKTRNSGGSIRCTEKSKVFWFFLTLQEWACHVSYWLWGCIYKLIIFQTCTHVSFEMWDACNYLKRNSWGFQFGN